MVKFCIECGASNPGKFCSECGHRSMETSTVSSSSSSSSATSCIVPMASAFRRENSPYGGDTFHHTLETSLKNGSSFKNGSFQAPASSLLMDTFDQVPPAATGTEAQEYYERCVNTIRASKGGNNEKGVKKFKHNCRKFGLKEMDVQVFYTSIVTELGAENTRTFIPTLARLVPDDARRKELMDYNAQQGTFALRKSGRISFGEKADTQLALVDTNTSMTETLRRDSTLSNNKEVQSKGILINRYADHPNCDVCNVQFEVTKRRHQCRYCGQFVCSSCSPVRLLVPPGRQIEGATSYDASIPQRVCIQCAPQLHPLQDELVATYAQSQTENIHETRSRFHAPYTTSLNKECCNAADIIGNFFRSEWGSSADRAIPVAFLQKAHGLAVMTVIKAGFLVSGKIGTGLVVAKLPDGSWSAPSAIGTFGLSGGFEIGGELVEVMVILGSEKAVKVFHKPQVNLGAGLDIAVGPYGRSAQAAAAASTSGLNANYSYSHSKGLYAGISLQGAILTARSDLNRKFYGRELQPSELLSGYVEQPTAARPLYEAIDNAMRGIEDHKEVQLRRSLIMGPCRLCNCPMFQAHTTQVWNKKCKTCSHAH
ncbi:unnamed protein product [Peronospora farinosa]|uniref:FYVE-type domain-containing protein n=1 Tax=Peronospora farinosa TaxID=134698 RepID=A0AAV0SWN7_9STRA|nr:unnamed protein product [Peronospora farinosa]